MEDAFQLVQVEQGETFERGRTRVLACYFPFRQMQIEDRIPIQSDRFSDQFYRKEDLR